MARLTARILKLERLLRTGLEAELRALSDEELEQRLDELLPAARQRGRKRPRKR